MSRKPKFETPLDSDDLELRFPAMRTAEQKWSALLTYAVLAPSIRNTQPWLWKIEGEALGLYLDNSRLVPAMDPDSRESIISCGASLMNLRLALRHFGYRGEVDYTPNDLEPELLARVRFGERARPTLDEDMLFFAIPQRHTNRGAFDSRVVPADILKSLRQEAKNEGAWLHFVEGETNWQALLELIARGDQIQWHDPEFRSDVGKWVRPNNSESPDGIPGTLLGINELASRFAPFALKFIDCGPNIAKDDLNRAESSSVLAVLGTDSNSPGQWLKVGEALSRVLLRSCAGGLAASFFNQPIEVLGLWPQLRQIIGRSGFPQLIFRLGYAAEDAHLTPRRSPGQVLSRTDQPLTG